MNKAYGVERTKPTLCAGCGWQWSMIVPERDWWLKLMQTDPWAKMPDRCVPCRKNTTVIGPGCVGSGGRAKTRYSTLERAQYAEERYRRDRGFNRKYPYECLVCLGFHLRSKPPNGLEGPHLAQIRNDNPSVERQDKPRRDSDVETREKVRQSNEAELGAAWQHEHLRVLYEAA
jgi:hypothetical protein